MIKVGIDSYCYHRYFGEIYDIQPKTDIRWTYEKFVERARELEVDGVSLETCFLPSIEEEYIRKLRSMLDKYNLARVLAWGHPDGFEGGKNEKALDDLRKHFNVAKALGTNILRIVGSSLKYRDEPHEPQLKRLTKILKKACEEAETYGLILAIENHVDFTSDEILTLINRVGFDNLKVNLDTGNALRMFEDPVQATEKLAPYTVSTHIKDLSPVKNGKCYNTRAAPRDWFFWCSVPLGDGIIDIAEIIRVLHDAGYKGFYAVEIDILKEGYKDEDEAVEKSIKYLKSLKF
ncbi:MAG: sugar phosphate isomerase/epimerase family protein [Candidatus Bathyarchaeia archaeon]